MVYKLDDRPPVAVTLLVALQHLLAVFGGILTAPLVVALGMGLSVEQTSYLISSALVVSGFATAIQILRAGPLPGNIYIGSGLLSIQGTSFAFIGPLIFSYQDEICPGGYWGYPWSLPHLVQIRLIWSPI